MPWMIFGDFNLMYFSTDKNNSSFHQDDADAFNETINNLSLIELPLTDRLYTWSSNSEEPKLQRIDRVFVNTASNQIFPNS
jgi:endonuclease/exonuclease/phosphatase family metal-dependent hydrolase